MSTQRHPRLTSAIELLESRIAPATFMVTSLLDDNSGGTLREMIDLANADPNTVDTITFRKDVVGKIELTGALQAIQITGPLSIKGPGAAKLSISGGDGIRIFFITDSDPGTLSPTTISNLSLIDGGLGTNGGALFSEEPLTLKNVVVASSSANALGGGIYVDTPGKVVITGSAFLGNEAGTDGGGLWVRAEGGIVMKKTTIADNEAFGAGGAALSSPGAIGSISLDQVSVLRNESDGAGGGLVVQVDANRSTVLKNSLLAGNSSAGGNGGGLFRKTGPLVVTGTIFSDNSAVLGGGLGAFSSADPISVTKGVFVNNASTDVNFGGGALFPGLAPLTIASSQFLHNTAGGDGGALWNNLGGGPIKISSSVFVGNSAEGDGGAISLDAAADLTLKSNVFSANRAAEGGAIQVLAGGSLTINGGSFLDNAAAVGGAIKTSATVSSGVETVSITGALFLRNSASIAGGAMLLTNGSATTVKGSKFIENLGGTGGGAIYLSGVNAPTSLEIFGSLFRANVGENGGGIYAGGASATLSITSSSLLGNVAHFATGSGGGVYLEDGAAVLSKTKIIGNFAHEGGGFYLTGGGSVTFSPTDTKITGNFASLGPDTSGF